MVGLISLFTRKNSSIIVVNRLNTPDTIFSQRDALMNDVQSIKKIKKVLKSVHPESVKACFHETDTEVGYRERKTACR